MQLLQRMAIYMPSGKELNPPRKFLRQYYQVIQSLTKAVNPLLNVLNSEYGAECMTSVAEHILMRPVLYL
jgi:hypothetical protein